LVLCVCQLPIDFPDRTGRQIQVRDEGGITVSGEGIVFSEQGLSPALGNLTGVLANNDDSSRSILSLRIVFEGCHSDALAEERPVALLEVLLLQAAVHPVGDDVVYHPFLQVFKVYLALIPAVGAYQVDLLLWD